MTFTIPRTADDLTPAWCAEALGRPIDSVTAEPLGVGVGLVGQLFRVTLDGPDGSSTLIAKLAAPTDEGRFVATVLNMYGREVGFYSELSPRTNVLHPRCAYAAHDPETQDAVILLEDVSPRGRLLDSVAGVSLAEARGAIRCLAKHHAAFWDDASLADTPWLKFLSDDPYPGAVAFSFDTAWPRAQEFFSDLIDDRVKQFGDGYPAAIPALFAKLSEPPVVFAHGDWRLDNLFLTPDDEVIAVDWQLVDRSVGPRDLAYLVTESINVTDPAEYDEALDLYLDDLAAHGITPDRAWAREMYRYGTALGFAYPVIAAGALTIEDPRHIELTGTMLDRCIRAMDALDVYSLAL
jgi:hypothetical protein